MVGGIYFLGANQTYVLMSRGNSPTSCAIAGCRIFSAPKEVSRRSGIEVAKTDTAGLGRENVFVNCSTNSNTVHERAATEAEKAWSKSNGVSVRYGTRGHMVASVAEGSSFSCG